MRSLALVLGLMLVLVGCQTPAAPAAGHSPDPAAKPPATPNAEATVQARVQTTMVAARPTAVPRAAAPATPTPSVRDLLRVLDDLWAQGAWVEAIQLLDELEELDPTALDFTDKRYAAHYAAGQDLVRKGNAISALTQFAKANQLDPERPEARAALEALSSGTAPAVAAPAAAPVPVVPASLSAPDGNWVMAATDRLLEYDRHNGTVLVSTLERTPVFVRPLRGAWGAFTIGTRQIYLSSALENESIEAVAAVLAHETQHAADVLLHGPPRTEVACHNFELTAFKVEAGVWMMAHGANGKDGPATELERELNHLLHLMRTDPARAVRELTHQYEDQCG